MASEYYVRLKESYLIWKSQRVREEKKCKMMSTTTTSLIIAMIKLLLPYVVQYLGEKIITWIKSWWRKRKIDS